VPKYKNLKKVFIWVALFQPFWSQISLKCVLFPRVFLV